MVLGNRIIIKSNGTTIAASKSNEIHTECEVIEIASLTNAQWREFITGRKQWSLNLTFLVTALKPANIGTNVPDPRNPLSIGSTYTIVIQQNAQGTEQAITLSGTAICRDCRITSTVGNLSNGTIILQGTGALT